MKWDAQYDVIVLGFGGAGATAARFAADKGAHVLLVDAAPAGAEGGNTRYAKQQIATGQNQTELMTYFSQLAGSYSIPVKMLQKYVSKLVTMPEYLKRYLDIDITGSDQDRVHGDFADYPEFDGHEILTGISIQQQPQDSTLWQLLRAKVLERSQQIDIWLNSRAQKLVYNPATKLVEGVAIVHQNQLEHVSARHGVVLATGGFQANPQMVQDFLHLSALKPLGTQFDRGDGIRLAEGVGARLWHMSTYEAGNVLGGLTIAANTDQQLAILTDTALLNHGATCVVAEDGTRFFDEAQPTRHGYLYQHGNWVMPQRVNRAYLIFDRPQYDAFKQQGHLSSDPSYLIRAETLPELAEKIQVSAANLKQTVQDFNHFAETGRDYTTGRDTQTMWAFDVGPGGFFAIQLTNDIVTTQGGPQRNEHCQVINVNNQPIGHLFSAGTLGSMIVNRYQTGTNLAECLISGKIAGENAATASDLVAASENKAQ
ncbi:FAD-binding protein [Secundilactobacillus hailunensis]|uniref:FAD-binding protein n=1 Tax=Secundilactobacillus hailunensis TaxID=2559923 RepID=A0ABW1TBP9_9LACO|nr:FAD-binding protein [Secundilactobacillus hailunensis]